MVKCKGGLETDLSASLRSRSGNLHDYPHCSPKTFHRCGDGCRRLDRWWGRCVVVVEPIVCSGGGGGLRNAERTGSDDGCGHSLPPERAWRAFDDERELEVETGCVSDVHGRAADSAGIHGVCGVSHLPAYGDDHGSRGGCASGGTICEAPRG